jgi:hypothetical protein
MERFRRGEAARERRAARQAQGMALARRTTDARKARHQHRRRLLFYLTNAPMPGQAASAAEATCIVADRTSSASMLRKGRPMVAIAGGQAEWQHHVSCCLLNTCSLLFEAGLVISTALWPVPHTGLRVTGAPEAGLRLVRGGGRTVT